MAWYVEERERIGNDSYRTVWISEALPKHEAQKLKDRLQRYHDEDSWSGTELVLQMECEPEVN